MGTYSKAERRNPAEMGEPLLLVKRAARMASAVAQDGLAAGRDGRKGGARPARVGGAFMHFMYRFLPTLCDHVRAASRVCLMCRLGVWKCVWHVDSDIL